MKEQRKAISALSCALHDALRDPLTETTYIPVLKACSTALDMHTLSKTTGKKTSTFKSHSAKRNLTKNRTP